LNVTSTNKLRDAFPADMPTNKQTNTQTRDGIRAVQISRELKRGAGFLTFKLVSSAHSATPTTTPSGVCANTNATRF